MKFNNQEFSLIFNFQFFVQVSGFVQVAAGQPGPSPDLQLTGWRGLVSWRGPFMKKVGQRNVNKYLCGFLYYCDEFDFKASLKCSAWEGP